MPGRTPESLEYYRRGIAFCADWGLNVLHFRLADDQGSALRFPRRRAGALGSMILQVGKVKRIGVRWPEPQRVGVPQSSSVHFASVCDARNNNNLCCVVDDVHYPPVANPDAPLIFIAPQLFAACGSRVLGQCQNLPVDAVEHCISELVQFLLCRWFDLERVVRPLCEE
jgi:hypothetical protein